MSGTGVPVAPSVGSRMASRQTKGAKMNADLGDLDEVMDINENSSTNPSKSINQASISHGSKSTTNRVSGGRPPAVPMSRPSINN